MPKPSNKKITNITVIRPQVKRYFIDWDINISKLYAGCNKSKWDPDGSRYRRNKSLDKKIDKALGSSNKHISGYKRHCDAKKIAQKLAKIPEIKRVSIVERVVDAE